MANALANQGCNIVAIARRFDKLQEVCKEIEEKHGVQAMPIQCDITNTEQIEETVRKAIERFGSIEILVNNAGTGAVAHAEHITDEQFQSFIEAHPELETVSVAWNRQLTDVSCLLGLENLRNVVLSNDMQQAVASLGGGYRFELQIN